MGKKKHIHGCCEHRQESKLLTFDLTAIIVHTEIAFKNFKIHGTTNEINFDSLLSVK